jgi:hypothetical protein
MGPLPRTTRFTAPDRIPSIAVRFFDNFVKLVFGNKKCGQITLGVGHQRVAPKSTNASLTFTSVVQKPRLWLNNTRVAILYLTWVFLISLYQINRRPAKGCIRSFLPTAEQPQSGRSQFLTCPLLESRVSGFGI